MTPNRISIVFSLMLAAATFGQSSNRDDMKQAFEARIAQGREAATQMKIYTALRESDFGKLDAAMSENAGAERILVLGDLLFNQKEIDATTRETAKGVAAEMKAAAIAGAERPDQAALYPKVLTYSMKKSREVTEKFANALKTRKKASDELAKRINVGEKVKIDVAADKMFEAHEAVLASVRAERELSLILVRAQFEYKARRITERQYDEAKKISARLDELDKQWHPSKEQLNVYERARGPLEAVRMIIAQ